MDSFVFRHIRTSGRGSGSVEVTLPSALRQLVGLQCRITVRDGARTEIVLEPDMAEARTVFQQLWRMMARILLIEDPDEFSEREFCFSLAPEPSRGGQANLCWTDGLELARSAPRLNEAALARTVAGFGTALANRLSIGARHAAGFGAACAMLAAGACPFPNWQEPVDIAASALAGQGAWRPGTPLQATSPADPLFWDLCGPMFVAAADLFADWSEDDAGYAELSAAWRRGRAVEMNRG